MIQKPDTLSDPAQASDHGQTQSAEELRREHELVRSTGRISKPVMATAFGLVFLLLAVLHPVLIIPWPWALLLGAVGVLLVGWGLYVRFQPRRQHSQ